MDSKYLTSHSTETAPRGNRLRREMCRQTLLVFFRSQTRTAPERTVRCAHSSDSGILVLKLLQQKEELRDGSALQQPLEFSGLARKIFSGNLLVSIKSLPHRFLLYPYTKKETELGFQGSGRRINLRPLCNHQDRCLKTQDLRNSHLTHQEQA